MTRTLSVLALSTLLAAPGFAQTATDAGASSSPRTRASARIPGVSATRGGGVSSHPAPSKQGGGLASDPNKILTLPICHHVPRTGVGTHHSATRSAVTAPFHSRRN